MKMVRNVLIEYRSYGELFTHHTASATAGNLSYDCARGRHRTVSAAEIRTVEHLKIRKGPGCSDQSYCQRRPRLRVWSARVTRGESTEREGVAGP